MRAARRPPPPHLPRGPAERGRRARRGDGRVARGERGSRVRSPALFSVPRRHCSTEASRGGGAWPWRLDSGGLWPQRPRRGDHPRARPHLRSPGARCARGRLRARGLEGCGSKAPPAPRPHRVALGCFCPAEPEQLLATRPRPYRWSVQVTPPLAASGAGFPGRLPPGGGGSDAAAPAPSPCSHPALGTPETRGARGEPRAGAPSPGPRRPSELVISHGLDSGRGRQGGRV